MSYTGSRFKPSAREQEHAPQEKRKLPRDIIECPKCGRHYSPARRKPGRPEHVDSPACKALQIVTRMYELGYAQHHNLTSTRLAQRAQVPVQLELGATHTEQTYDQFGQPGDPNEVQHLVGFSPLGVVKLQDMLAGVPMTKDLRDWALHVLWDKQEALDTLDSARRLDDGIGKRLPASQRQFRELLVQLADEHATAKQRRLMRPKHISVERPERAVHPDHEAYLEPLPVTPNGGDITVKWDSSAAKIFKL